MDSNTEVFAYGFFTVTLFKSSGNFLRDIFAEHNGNYADFNGNKVFAKFIELAFDSKGCLYCVKNHIYVRIPMPMPMPMPRCRCRDFQMADWMKLYKRLMFNSEKH